MDNLYYKVFNPGGNKTALVVGTDYSKKQIKLINDTILYENPEVEQVGFISKKENRLNMAGGEFCVNAARCAIWEYLKGEEGQIKLKVSGLKEELTGGITDEDNVYINIPINKRISDLMYKKDKYHFIKLEGILLAIVNEEDSKRDIRNLIKHEKQEKNRLLEIMKKFESNERANGIILLEKEKNRIKINPIIWVKEMNTLYYETACGSGSLATAIYKNHIQGINNLYILQPSGCSVNVKLELDNGYLKNAIISGKVIKEE